MSRPESSTAQVVAGGSKLSADAQSFVPSKFMNGSSGSNGGYGAVQNLSPQQLSQLPSYMTTCYPFVQQADYQAPVQQNHTPRPSAPWQGSGRPGTGNFPGPRAPNLLQTGYIMTGNRAAGPHNVRPRHQGYVARQQFPSPGLAGTASQPFMGASGGPGMTQQPGAYTGGPRPFQIYPVQGRTSSTPNSWPPNVASEFPFTQGYYPPGSQLQTVDSSDSTDRGALKERKSSKKKKEATHNNMVSVGIQNESGILNGLNNHSSKKKAKTKTLILVDVGLQTDFSEEIANLTLAEKPNSLFKTRGWQERYQQDTTTTDSEEVDSDSGYSSPMHRRNQATVVTYIPTNSQPVLLNKPGYSYAAASATPGPVSTMPASPPYPTYAMAAHTTSYLPYTSAAGTYQSLESQSTKPTLSSVGGQASGGSVKTDPEDAGDATSGRRRRKRSRRRRRKTQDGQDIGALSDEPSDLHRAHSSSNVSRTSNDALDNGLKFEDEEEFPDLPVSGASGGVQQLTVGLSYSDILKSQPPANPVTPSSATADGCGYSSSSSSKERKQAPGTPKLSKNARKRQKRREAANRAAEEELAEITIEQQVLKELSAKQIKQNQTSSKKSKQPIALNFADMIDALERRQQEQQPGEKTATSVSVAGGAASKELQKDHKSQGAVNPLDSSSPAKRGKERETPKPKKPSPLKKVILKEREERKRQRLFEEQIMSPVSSAGSQLLPSSTAVTDSDFSQDGVSSKTSSVDQGTCSTPMSAEMSPISQTSPISMSPLSPGGSPLSSGVTSPIANSIIGERKPNVVMKIHSRRFREYCTQVLDKDIDGCCTQLLQDLVRFQDRLFHKDPTKAKSKRRIVLGLREVTKHLKLKKIKCVIISPNLERIQSKGGLDDALNNILDLCSEQNVPFVFALGRRALGRACAKLVPVSVAGVFNYEGTEDTFKRLMDLTEKARSAYDDMVMSLEKDISEMTQRSVTMTSAFPQIFSHLGHSRTPSACSAISFTSSILSEPISENYPYSEPETDSRGYEIIRDSLRDEAGETLSRLMCEDEQPDLNEDDEDNEEEEEEEGEEEEDEEEEEEQAEDSADSPNSSTNSNDKVIKIVENLHEIDEGNEADTEDYIDFQNTKQTESSTSDEAKADIDENSEGDADDNADDNDTIRDLPHISSIHSSQVDLTAEILSQHSSKTPDLNAEVQSTHSSRTPVEGGVSTPQDITSVEGHGQSFDITSPSGQKLKNINKERIESWVAETQHQMGKLSLQNGVEHEPQANAAQQSESKCLCNDETSASKEEVTDTGCGLANNQISCSTWNTCDQLYNNTNNNFCCQEQEQQT